VSGAGRKAEIPLLHAEVQENFRAYAVSGHRHLPEIAQGLQEMTQEKINLTFVPHLVPMIRGIHATLYATLKPEHRHIDLQPLFESYFQDEYFVNVLPNGQYPQTRFVRHTNRLQIAVERPQNGDTIVVMVVEDNLVKGASGQAVQAMNVMFGFTESTGLDQIAHLP
jgi:N-acetyl-gamma-glutamyl-phosphate reductase